MKIRVKRLVILNMALILVIFLTAGVVSAPPKDEDVIKDLIAQRTEILNRYYTGAEGFDETEKRLEMAEMGALLTEDRKNMKENSAADFDGVEKSKIEVLGCEKNSFGMVKGEVKITWTVQSPGGKRQLQSAEYFFTAETAGDRMKLTGLEMKRK